MCGICGFTRADGGGNRARDEEALRGMRDMARHRGPDAEGLYMDERVALGHRRLAVIDLRPEANQPFTYGPEGRYVLTYNGEIYNYKELRAQLEALGHAFSTESDTEVLAAMYAQYGAGCTGRLNGMWAFALYDKRDGVLFCSRDRFGVKPFYYTVSQGRFAFASEEKQLLPGLAGPVRANRSALAAFLVTGQLDGGEETMFEGVRQLPGGCNLTVELATGARTTARWYDLNAVPPRAQSFAEAAARFKACFEEAVRLRERSDVPVGYCLSGGLDSSSIVCTSARLKQAQGAPHPQRCVTSQSPVPGYDESEYVEAVRQATGAVVHTVRPQPQALFRDLDTIIWHMDEPFGSTSMFAQWSVFQKAAEEGLTVMLDGQGADEQLCGYTVAVSVALCELLRAGKKQEAKEQMAAWREKHPMKSAAFARRLWWLARLYRRLPEKTAARLMARALLAGKTPFSRRLKKQGLAASSFERVHTVRDHVFDAMHGGLAALLHYEDRNSMAFSIESRVPFLDVGLVEAVYAMPGDCKLRDGESKAVMRRAMEDVLPGKVRARQDKMGFVTPEAEWIKADPARFRAQLADACDALAPLVDKRRALAWFDAGKAFTAGDFTLWRILCAGRWVRVFGVQVAP